MIVDRNKNDNLIYGIVGRKGEAYIFKGETSVKFEKNVVETLQKNNQIELALRIKENGLEKTSQYYQTLQNKNAEGGN